MHVHKLKNIEKKCIEVNTEFEQTWLELAKSHSTLDNYDKAMYAYENALRCNKNSIEAMYCMCQMALVVNDKNKFISLIGRIAKFKDEDKRYHILCGHYFLKTDTERSYKHFVKALQGTVCHDEYLLYGVAMYKEMVGDYEGAKKIYLHYYNAFNFFSHGIVVFFRLGVVYKKLEQYDIAIRIFNILKQMKKLNIITRNDVLVQLAHVFERQSKDDDAIKIIDEIFDNDTKHQFANRLHAWINYKNKTIESESVKDETKPLDAYCYYIQGRYFIDSCKTKEAIEMLNTALDLEDGDPWIWNSLGFVHYSRENHKKAKECFSMAHALDETCKIYEDNLLASSNKVEPENIEMQECALPDSKEDLSSEPLNAVVDVLPDIFDSYFFDTHLLFGCKIYIRNKVKKKSHEFIILKK